MFGCSVCSDSSAHFIPHRFAFQCGDPCGLLYSLHKPLHVTIGFCPPGCYFPVLEPLLFCVFFKFMAVEGRSVIRFDLFRHSVCVEHPPEYRDGCLFACGCHEFNSWVSGVLTIEYDGEVSISHWSAKVHAELVPWSVW